MALHETQGGLMFLSAEWGRVVTRTPWVRARLGCWQVLCRDVRRVASKRGFRVIIPGESLASFGINVQGPVVLASMGIYVFTHDRSLFEILLQMPHFEEWSIVHLPPP